jgi:hypothetical protein
VPSRLDPPVPLVRLQTGKRDEVAVRDGNLYYVQLQDKRAAIARRPLSWRGYLSSALTLRAHKPLAPLTLGGSAR